MLVVYYIAPASAIAMTPMALLDILDEDLSKSELTPSSIAQVVLLILGTGVFSFGLIFAEVRSNECTLKVGWCVCGMEWNGHGHGGWQVRIRGEGR